MKGQSRPLIPLLPLPWAISKPLLALFRPFASILHRLAPTLERDLAAAEIDLTAQNYLSGAVLAGVFYGVCAAMVMLAYFMRAGELTATAQLASLGFAFCIFSAALSYSIIYPNWRASQNSVEIDYYLLFAIRHLRVQTSAGVPLFDAIVSVSGDSDPLTGYGVLSTEFRKVVSEVRAGKHLSDALDESASRNYSQYYRRMLWQLSNANRAGVEIKGVLFDMQEFLANEQAVLIREYGAQLNPLSLFYMVATIIGPTMGLIFLMVASSLVELPVNEFTLFAMLVILIFVQFMFLGLIKSRRPRVSI